MSEADAPDMQVVIAINQARLAKQLAAMESNMINVAKRFEKKSSFKIGGKGAEESAKAIGKQMDDLRAKFDPLFAKSRQYEAKLEELNRAHKLGAINAQVYQRSLDALNEEFALGATKVSGAEKGVRRFGGVAQQIGYQVGDFAVQVGAGTSALQAFGQQAPQLLGAFGTYGALAGAAVAIAAPLAKAFLGAQEEAKPLKDVMAELEQVTAAYVKAAEDALTPVDELREKYGDMADEVQRALELQRDLAKVQATSILERTRTSLVTSLGGDFDTANGEKFINAQFLARDMKIRSEKAVPIAKALNDIYHAEDLAAATAAVEALNAALASAAGSAEEAAKKWGGEEGALTTAASYLEQMREQFGAGMTEAERTALRLSSEYDARTRKLVALTRDRAAAEQMLADARAKGDAEGAASAARIVDGLDDAISAATDAGSRVSDMREELERAGRLAGAAALNGDFEAETKAAGEELSRAAAHAEDLGDADLSKLEARVRSLVELAQKMAEGFSAAGGALTRAEGQGYREYYASRVAGAAASYSGGMGSAMDRIRAAEGFRAEAYWDVNHPRAGYGSDTFTNPDGTYGTVTEGSVVTLEQAEADLRRRISGYFDVIMQQIGRTAFDALTDDQKGAMASLLHNYGSGEFSASGDLSQVLASLKAGSDGATADAIARRGADNGGVNRDRRLDEAGAFGGASVALLDHLSAEQKALEAQVKAREDLAKATRDYGESLTRAIADGEFEASIVGKSAAEQARLRAEYQLTQQAKAQGIDLNAKLAGSEMTVAEAIKAKAAADAQAAIAAEERKAAEARATAQMQAAAQAQQSFVSGSLDAVMASGNLGDALRQLALMFIRAKLQAALFGSVLSNSDGSMTSSGGLLSGLFNGIGKLFSFEGGGSTPSGPRAGGIDGKGGFLAVVHPDETIIDHAKGQVSSRVALPVAGVASPTSAGIAMQASRMTLTDDGKIIATVRAEMSQSLTAYDQGMPARVQAIQTNPRNR